MLGRGVSTDEKVPAFRPVQIQRPVCGSVGLLDIATGTATIVRHYRVNIGEPYIRESVSGVFGNSLIEIGNGDFKIRKGPLVPVGSPLQTQLIGFWILCRWLAFCLSEALIWPFGGSFVWKMLTSSECNQSASKIAHIPSS